MYSLCLPPEVVNRLYRLREEHEAGPIRRQVLMAVTSYLDVTEAQLGLPSEAPASPRDTPGVGASTSPRRNR